MHKLFLAIIILIVGILIGVQQLYFLHVFDRICWLPQDQYAKTIHVVSMGTDSNHQLELIPTTRFANTYYCARFGAIPQMAPIPSNFPVPVSILGLSLPPIQPISGTYQSSISLGSAISAMVSAIQTKYDIPPESIHPIRPDNSSWGDVLYANDARHVYSVTEDLTGGHVAVTNVGMLLTSDPNTFDVLAGSLAKDDTYVYLNGVVQPGIDPKTFKKLNKDEEGLYGDSHSIYYFGDTGSGIFTLMSIHPSGFFIYDLVAQDPNHTYGTFQGYWSDGQALYYGTSTITVADARKFAVYSKDIVASSTALSIGERWMPLYYGSDGIHVFYKGRVVTGADPATFTTVSDGIYYQEYGKDKDHVYFEDTTIQGADPSTFKTLKEQPSEGCGPGAYAIDSRDVFYRNKIVEGADPVSFKPVIGQNEYGEDIHGFYEDAERIDKSTFVACQYG
jgi:hypothetical protein